MQKKSFLLGFGAAVLVGGLTVYTVSGASADEVGARFQGKFNSEERQVEREQHRVAMDEIFTNGDYEGWKAMMEERNPANVIDSQEDFNKLAQAHQLMKDGNVEATQAIRDELGLQGGPRHGMTKGQGQGRGMENGNCPYVQ